MDQSKWAIPRHRGGALCHHTMKCEKPRLKLQCVWVHNASISFYLIDPRVAADSSMVTECLARSLELLCSQCARRGVQEPRQLSVWVPRHRFGMKATG